MNQKILESLVKEWLELEIKRDVIGEQAHDLTTQEWNDCQPFLVASAERIKTIREILWREIK